MKQYFKILFSAIVLLLVGTGVKPATSNGSSPLKSNVPNTCSVSNMKGNNPVETHFILLFRNGVDEKGLCFKYSPKQYELIKDTPDIDELQLNAGLVKHVLTFYDFLALPPEFLATAAFRSPPASC